MVMYTGHSGIISLAEDVLNQIKTRISASPNNLPERVGILPGAISWDECECGQLVISLTRIYLSSEFISEPGAAFSSEPCGAPLFMNEFLVQIIRCAPVISSTGTPPTMTALENSFRTVAIDAYETLVAVSCFLPTLEDSNVIHSFVVYDQLVVGPEGGCVGSELKFTVALTNLGS